MDNELVESLKDELEAVQFELSEVVLPSKLLELHEREISLKRAISGLGGYND